MGLASDLLVQAEHLASYQGIKPSQAALRRSVSIAYYALFHLLIEDAGQRWRGASAAGVTGLERALNHGQMKSSSLQFKAASWKDWHGNVQSVPSELRIVAGTFIALQDERHQADYNNYKTWTLVEVQALLEGAAIALRNWEAIRTHPMAGNYLLSALLGKLQQNF